MPDKRSANHRTHRIKAVQSRAKAPAKRKTRLPAQRKFADPANRALYEGIVQSAKDAVIAVNEQQRIVLFNPAAEAIFRCTAAQVLGSPLDRFIPAHLHAAHRKHVQQYRRRHDPVRAMGGDRVLTGLRADGEEFPIDVTISHVSIGRQKRFVAVLRDVTERVRAREDLQRYSDIVDTSDDAIFSRALDGRILTWNPAAERIFGYTQQEVIGKTINMLYSANASRGQSDLTAAAMRGERIVNFETVRTRKDGQDIDVAITISLIRDGTGRVTGSSAIMRDISERKRMERALHESLRQQKHTEEALRESRDRLRELSAALQSIREAEKTRIARELHDELGQSLTALKMDAAVIANDLQPDQQELRKRADGMKRLIDTTVTSVRRISADLRPVMLDNLGLAPTLEWLAKDCSSRNGIRVDLSMSDEDLHVGGEIATAVFRIVQEALTNVVRHARATTARVEVVRTAGQVLVRVTDNGHGMAAEDQRKSHSFGLLGMRERAYVLGGDFTVSSGAGQGTIIEAILPAPHIGEKGKR